MSGLFQRLRAACGADWEAYTHHPFVRGLAAGDLPAAAFRYYLVQDYLFLIQFARAFGLAAYKADNLADLRDAADGLHGILETEIGHHTEYCANWGLTPADLEAATPDRATLAYTRYVLERGMAGDLLDLKIALAPCIIGYGEIGRRLDEDAATCRKDNAYASWIEIYSGERYQGFVAAEIDALDRLSEKRGGEARFDALCETFRTATILEAEFWQMGLDAAQ